MSKKNALVGESFYKYEERYGIEECHVLAHDPKGNRYFVAFSRCSHKPGDVPAVGVGRVEGNLSNVTDWVVENYATQDQAKLKRLLKMDKKRRALANEIESEAQQDWQERAPVQSSSQCNDDLPF